mmetsp:Transcript_5925/g.16590  ORF Transcript_5925/g.16590 Transcript_5925/m.16590 type:complete len:355 (+) Transcript_5925:240-1304(+)
MACSRSPSRTFIRVSACFEDMESTYHCMCSFQAHCEPHICHFPRSMAGAARRGCLSQLQRWGGGRGRGDGWHRFAAGTPYAHNSVVLSLQPEGSLCLIRPQLRASARRAGAQAVPLGFCCFTDVPSVGCVWSNPGADEASLVPLVQRRLGGLGPGTHNDWNGHVPGGRGLQASSPDPVDHWFGSFAPIYCHAVNRCRSCTLCRASKGLCCGTCPGGLLPGRDCEQHRLLPGTCRRRSERWHDNSVHPPGCGDDSVAHTACGRHHCPSGRHGSSHVHLPGGPPACGHWLSTQSFLPQASGADAALLSASGSRHRRDDLCLSGRSSGGRCPFLRPSAGGMCVPSARRWLCTGVPTA